MDDEWEEEEQLVVVELAGTLSNEFLTKNKSTCKVLDIDSDKPFIQVGQFVFAGEYEDALGTSMLFEELPRKGKDSTTELKYMCHTVKKLMMQRVFLTEKKEGETGQGGTGDSGEQDDAILLSDDEETGAELDDTHNTVDVEDSLLG
ncbi:hypothetical protein NL108_006028 [Boleophthalmus pectinirostris]|uniref:general transcription factor 3C polypeptide 6 n=1 Tax=Boleophthalmus pectinirostris TaxID=150288 RepID=UPI002432566F|nr:general transcription factor 3C polypeptide 6 [Boleophthalmus pectinirostris]KAJ0069419.1 hypothetical protein NL108_006028 [Boleophthalmus pectinirostris]